MMTLITLAAMAASAFASTDSPTTRLDDMKARFEKASLPKIERTKGWYSGRCYTPEYPDMAVGALMVLSSRNPKVNEGPMYAGQVTKLMIMGQGDDGLSADPVTFDKMSKDTLQEVKDNVEIMFSNDFHTAVTVDGASLASTVHQETRFEIRRDKKFIYGMISDLKKNAPMAYCYFFKKVR